MSEKKDYADQWDVSAKFFYEQGYYSWMAQQVEKIANCKCKLDTRTVKIS